MRNINLLLLGLATLGALSSRPAFAQSVPAAAPEQSQSKSGQSKDKPVEAGPAVSPSAVRQIPPESTADIPPAAAPKGRVGPRKPPADAKSAFVIGPEDVLAVRVWDEPGLSGPVTVGPDGMISLQLIHEVKAAGLTTAQLEAALTEQFEQFRNNPDVSVQVVNVRSRKYMIQGGVSRTGSFPLTGPTTVLEALVNGGGFKEFSNPKKIYILRTKADGTTAKINFNYKDVSKGKHMEQNILVQNGDQIFIPE
jgi:polysaccharide export outer membrane protein